MRKTTKAILTVSILFNLLFMGLALGAGIRYAAHAPGSFSASLRLHGFAPESQALVTRAMEDGRAFAAPKLKEMQAARAALSEIMRAETFDPAAFETKAMEIREIKNDMARHRIESTIALAAQLSAEERRKLADHFEKAYKTRNWHTAGLKSE